MTRYGMIIDISKCTGCYNCFSACKDEYWDNDYLPYSVAQPKFGQFWLNLLKKERGTYPSVKIAYMPLLCMHCNDAPCIEAADDNAVYRRPDGIVIIDPDRAVGQRWLLQACPYGVIYWNEEKNIPQKCTFCVHRLEVGKIPRCVQVCPSRCLSFGELENTASEVSQLIKNNHVETFHPEYVTNPAIYYQGLYNITKYFLSGVVVYKDTDECAEGVLITLDRDIHSLTTYTDNYGLFEFDGLDSGDYTVKIECEGYLPKTYEVKLITSHYLGEILLVRM